MDERDWRARQVNDLVAAARGHLQAVVALVDDMTAVERRNAFTVLDTVSEEPSLDPYVAGVLAELARYVVAVHEVRRVPDFDGALAELVDQVDLDGGLEHDGD